MMSSGRPSKLRTSTFGRQINSKPGRPSWAPVRANNGAGLGGQTRLSRSQMGYEIGPATSWALFTLRQFRIPSTAAMRTTICPMASVWLAGWLADEQVKHSPDRHAARVGPSPTCSAVLGRGPVGRRRTSAVRRLAPTALDSLRASANGRRRARKWLRAPNRQWRLRSAQRLATFCLKRPYLFIQSASRPQLSAPPAGRKWAARAGGHLFDSEPPKLNAIHLAPNGNCPTAARRVALIFPHQRAQSFLSYKSVSRPPCRS